MLMVMTPGFNVSCLTAALAYMVGDSDDDDDDVAPSSIVRFLTACMFNVQPAHTHSTHTHKHTQ